MLEHGVEEDEGIRMGLLAFEGRKGRRVHGGELMCSGKNRGQGEWLSRLLKPLALYTKNGWWPERSARARNQNGQQGFVEPRPHGPAFVLG